MITLQVALPPVRRGIQDSLAELMQAEMSQNEAQMMDCSNDTCSSRMLKRVDKVFTEPFSKALVVKLRRRNYDEQILDLRLRNGS